MSGENHPGKDADWSVWMAAAQAGDRDAYRRLLRAITPYVRAIAARLLTHPSDIEDAVQNVLIAVHEARRSYDPARPFRPWLAGIARHRIIDQRRASHRRSAREVPLTQAHEAIMSAEPFDALGDSGLTRAIRQLPAAQRLAIERLKLREHSLLRVARETGVSVGALKVATHRGLRRLRSLLLGEQTA